MKLYFVRHGESAANTQHVISNRESPFRLTERGRRQVVTLADNLKEVPFTEIFSSPILRARETAEILSQAFDLDYQVTESLREYDCGVLEEKSDEDSWRLHRAFYEDWTLRHNHSSKPAGGECFVDIQKRFLPLIESFKHESGGNVLLIGHGGLFHLMLPLVLANIAEDFVRTHWIAHTECVIAELHADGFICQQWGAVQF